MLCAVSVARCKTREHVKITAKHIPQWMCSQERQMLPLKRIKVSFAQWHYRSQWGLSEARLLLIENFSQYPARRLEIQSALQFLMVHMWTLQKWRKILINFAYFNYFCLFQLILLRALIYKVVKETPFLTEEMPGTGICCVRRFEVRPHEASLSDARRLEIQSTLQCLMVHSWTYKSEERWV